MNKYLLNYFLIDLILSNINKLWSLYEAILCVNHPNQFVYVN